MVEGAPTCNRAPYRVVRFAATASFLSTISRDRRRSALAFSLLLGGCEEAVVKRRTIAWIVVPVLLDRPRARAGDAREVVEIRLHGHYFTEPATVRFIVAVEPDAETARCASRPTATEMFRASEVSLDGASEKRLHTLLQEPAGRALHAPRPGAVVERRPRNRDQRNGRDRRGPAITARARRRSAEACALRCTLGTLKRARY